MNSDAMFNSTERGFSLLRRGKVRDVYEPSDEYLLIVACDRISAFDSVLPTPIPDKGKILTQISNFWFTKSEHIIQNHIVDPNPGPKWFPEVDWYYPELDGRTVLVRKTEPLVIEAIVRGYLSGSGWKEYQKSGTVCDIKLPSGLLESDKLPETIFTPSTKAQAGHDENISFEKAADSGGHRRRHQGARHSHRPLRVRRRLRPRARHQSSPTPSSSSGSWTNGELMLIDEMLTPDSSRFWPAESYKPGGPQASFDKQYVRDYLEAIKWNKEPPAPPLPDDVVEQDPREVPGGRQTPDSGRRRKDGDHGSTTTQVLKVGDPAPDFEMPDVLTGDTVKSADLLGSPVLLYFARGTWCPTCRRWMDQMAERLPELREARRTRDRRGGSEGRQRRRRPQGRALPLPRAVRRVPHGGQGVRRVRAGQLRVHQHRPAVHLRPRRQGRGPLHARGEHPVRVRLLGRHPLHPRQPVKTSSPRPGRAQILLPRLRRPAPRRRRPRGAGRRSRRARRRPLGNRCRFTLVAATQDDRDALKGLGTYGFIKGATGFIVGAVRPGPGDMEDYGYLSGARGPGGHRLGAGHLLARRHLQQELLRPQDRRSSRDEVMPAVVATGYPTEDSREHWMRSRIGAERRLPPEQLFFEGGPDHAAGSRRRRRRRPGAGGSQVGSLRV